MTISYSCTDFFGFQESLKKMRDMDDKIVHALNTSIPTESFKGQINSENSCADLYTKLHIGHKQREEAIKNCILMSVQSVKELREQRAIDQENTELLKKLNFEHRKLRLLQSELLVEEIVKKRSLKVFHERCRSYVQPL